MRLKFLRLAIFVSLTIIFEQLFLGNSPLIRMPSSYELLDDQQSTINHPIDSINRLNFINSQFVDELETTLNNSCDARNLKVTPCLGDLHQLDQKFSQIKSTLTNYHPSMECFNRSKLLFHSFWRIEEDFCSSRVAQFNMRMLKLNVMSFLATQNLFCSKLILWKLSSFPYKYELQIRALFEPYFRQGIISMFTFDVSALCDLIKSDAKAYEFSLSGICRRKINSWFAYKSTVSFSDLVRFMLLDVYGGIYTDGDVIYLKDMQILHRYTFAYRWSRLSAVNTAVLGVNRENRATNHELYSLFVAKSNTIGRLVRSLHPQRLSKSIVDRGHEIFEYRPLRVLHVSFFDPAWLCNDNVRREVISNVCKFSDFTKQVREGENVSVSSFFPGAFAYHIHLSAFGTVNICGREIIGEPLEIKEFSIFYHFELFFKSKLGLVV